MFEGSDFVRIRVLPVLAVAALAVGGAACGSDSDDGGSAAADGGSGDTQPVANDTKAQVEAAYDEFVEDLYKGRFDQACDGYSAELQKSYPKLIKVADTCVKTLKLEFSNVGAQPRPWIEKVTVESPTRAIGLAKTRKDSKGGELVFVKENGAWKLDGPPKQGKKAGS